MQLQPVDLIGGFYKDDSLPWSCQDTVNWIPEQAEVPGPRSAWRLRGAPGLKLFSNISNKPVRGARNVEGKLFVVSGNKLYEVAINGTATERGTIPGVGRVAMSHNQLSAGGNQLIVVNGSSGYVWNTATSVFAKITDPGYPGSGCVDFIDTYFPQADPFGRFWFHSNQSDGLDYSTLDRYPSEADPDGIVAVAERKLEVVVFNKGTIEFFGNVGTNTRTFASKRIVIKVGCAGRHTIAKLADTLIFLGSDGIVYMLDGYGARPLSTGPVQKAMTGKNLAQAFAMVYETPGHKIYYLTFPDGETWGFDVVTQLWHRRKSQGFNRWRASTLTLWNGKWIAGDFQTGNLYEVDWATFEENGHDLVAERVTGVMHSNQQAIEIAYAELVAGMGQVPLGVEHAIEMTYSDDGGRNWKNWKKRSLGRTGEYGKRIIFRQLGRARNRVWKLRVSSRGSRDLIAAVVQANGTDG